MEKNVITNKGRELIARAIGEKKTIQITAIKCGDGSYDESENLLDITRLKNSKKAMSCIEIKPNKDYYYTIKCYVDNREVTDGFKIQEIGIFAKIKDSEEEEILYSLSVNDDYIADYLPKYDGRYPTRISYNLYISFKGTNTPYIQLDSNDTDVRFQEIISNFDSKVGEIKTNLNRTISEYNDRIETATRNGTTVIDTMLNRFPTELNNYEMNLKIAQQRYIDELDALGERAKEKIDGKLRDIDPIIEKLKEEIKKNNEELGGKYNGVIAELENIKKSLISNMDKNIFTIDYTTLNDIEIINGIWDKAGGTIYC